MSSAVRQDLMRRTMFVSCDGQWYFAHHHGGVRAEVRWYGPLSVAALAPVALARVEHAAPSR